MKQPFLVLSVCLASAFAASCGSSSEASYDAEPEVASGDPASQVESMNVAIAELQASAEKDIDRVEVQHILISFAGVPNLNATRVRPDAEALAAEIYCRLIDGEDMDELVREYTDDSPPGIYVMNTSQTAPGEYLRSGMVPAFGDVGWRLAVGEIGVAPYEPKKSPFGWHIIKRLN